MTFEETLEIFEKVKKERAPTTGKCCFVNGCVSPGTSENRPIGAPNLLVMATRANNPGDTMFHIIGAEKIVTYGNDAIEFGDYTFMNDPTPRFGAHAYAIADGNNTIRAGFNKDLCSQVAVLFIHNNEEFCNQARQLMEAMGNKQTDIDRQKIDHIIEGAIKPGGGFEFGGGTFESVHSEPVSFFAAAKRRAHDMRVSIGSHLFGRGAERRAKHEKSEGNVK